MTTFFSLMRTDFILNMNFKLFDLHNFYKRLKHCYLELVVFLYLDLSSQHLVLIKKLKKKQ